jgi:hypothetical protein
MRHLLTSDHGNGDRKGFLPWNKRNALSQESPTAMASNDAGLSKIFPFGGQ